MEITEEQIARNLKGGDTYVNEQPDVNQLSFRKAAVLVPLFRKTGDWHLLYTRRSEGLQFHSGQVSFPGGAAEPGDSGPVMTALRESYEEIGLEPDFVRVLGCMGEYVTITQYSVTPVVGVIPPPDSLRLQANEVSHVFSIPLDWLAKRENWEERLYTAPDGQKRPVIFFKPYQEELLWGITARMTVNFLQLLNLV